MAQERPGDAGDDDGDDQGDDESERCCLHAVDEVHTEHRGDERRNHQDDGDRRERTHHGVHVVVDDAGVGVHGRLEDVRVDGGGLAGLRHLNVYVLDKVVVQLIDL